MYPKKTLSVASLLSECERKRRRTLEARGCDKSESESSMGTAATCPFIMSAQSPRTTKLFHSVYARSNNQALRQTEIYKILIRSLNSFLPNGSIRLTSAFSSNTSPSSVQVDSPLHGSKAINGLLLAVDQRMRYGKSARSTSTPLLRYSVAKRTLRELSLSRMTASTTT